MTRATIPPRTERFECWAFGNLPKNPEAIAAGGEAAAMGLPCGPWQSASFRFGYEAYLIRCAIVPTPRWAMFIHAQGAQFCDGAC